MPDTKKINQNVMRVGFSEGSTPLVLGEVPGSFGFGGTGKKVTKRTYITYGKPFNVGDTIGCYMDLDSKPMTISFSRNGEWFGEAFKLEESMRDCAIFPHIFLKNVKVTAWFGVGPKPKWSCSKANGYELISNVPREDRVLPPFIEPKKKSDCDCVMLIGLPATGKTTWAHNYVKKSGKKFDVLGTDLLLDQMRVYNMRRQGNFKERFDRCMKMASQCFNNMVDIAKTK
eukprot:UN02050